MTNLISFDHVRQALALTDFDAAAARQRMAPVPRGWQKRSAPPSRAAVLLMLFQAETEGLSAVLTRRNPHLRGHSGQVSFPGGRQDAQDASLTATALRETCEEIGICDEGLSLLGQLPQFYIPVSHYDVFPIVASYAGRPMFRANPAEVAEIFSVALADLLDPRFKCVEQRVIRGFAARVPYYAIKGHKVWGATAILLSELEERLRQVLPSAARPELE